MLLWFLLAVIVVVVVAYRFRVPLLAKLLGQSPARIQQSLERRKR